MEAKEFFKNCAAVCLVVADGFMHSAFFRNITAFIFDTACFAVTLFAGLYGWFGAYEKSAQYWWSFGGLIVLAFCLRAVAQRLWVTRVCPQCSENRAIRVTEHKTGNVIHGVPERNGDSWYRKIEEEYRITDECIYGCGYSEDRLEWRSHKERISSR